jgi:type I restriction enzyme S subunit
MEMTVPVPKYEEQQLVGKLFYDLDNLITLHQRKCFRVCTASKHFQPKIHIAWEQRKLGTMVEPIPNNTLSRADLNYEYGKIKNIQYGDILVKFGAIVDCKADEIPFITDGEIVDYKSQFLVKMEFSTNQIIFFYGIYIVI